VDDAFAQYRFDYAASALYEFTWYEFCDWYLEFAKPVLQGATASPGARLAARNTLLRVLETLLRALHPIMPFITEEIWQKVAPLADRPGESVMLAPWPRAADHPADPAAEQDVRWIQGFVLGVRQIRGEMDISPSRRLPVLLENASARDLACVAAHRPLLEKLAAVEGLEPLGAGDAAPPSATALVGELRVLVPMAGLIDAGAEAERLSKRIARAQDEIRRARSKLANDSFVRNAPPEVVAQERARLAEFEGSVATLEQQLERVRQLG
jgi:valyl-tRNA synthetase